MSCKTTFLEGARTYRYYLHQPPVFCPKICAPRSNWNCFLVQWQGSRWTWTSLGRPQTSIQILTFLCWLCFVKPENTFLWSFRPNQNAELAARPSRWQPNGVQKAQVLSSNLQWPFLVAYMSSMFNIFQSFQLWIRRPPQVCPAHGASCPTMGREAAKRRASKTRCDSNPNSNSDCHEWSMSK